MVVAVVVGGVGCCHIAWKICSSQIAVKTWEHFKRESRLLRPVSLRTMAECWDECARNALNEAAQYQGGGNFNTSIGNWEYIPARWKKLCGEMLKNFIAEFFSPCTNKNKTQASFFSHLWATFDRISQKDGGRKKEKPGSFLQCA
jgi:hypothetical protein